MQMPLQFEEAFFIKILLFVYCLLSIANCLLPIAN